MEKEQPEFSAEDIIQKFAVPAGTWDIDLPDGMKLVLRAIRSTDDMSAVQKKCGSIMRMIKRESYPKSWRAYLPKGDNPVSNQTALIIAEFSELVISPKFTDLQVLRMCLTAGPTAALVHQNIMQRTLGKVYETADEDIEEEKKDSEETD